MYRVFSLIGLLILLIVSPSLACDPPPPPPAPSAEANATAVGVGIGVGVASVDNHNLNQQGQIQGQDQAQQQGQAQTAYGGAGGAGGISSASSHTGDNSLSNNIVERTHFSAINPTAVRIGEVSKPVPQVYFQGQREDDPLSGDRSDAFQVGVTIPITWGTGVNSALSAERQHLVDRNLHEREKHQAEMAKVCMELHKYVLSTGAELSPELWNRCKGFEHTNNERINKVMENIPPPGRHNQEMNPRQFSPHSQPYHK